MSIIGAFSQLLRYRYAREFEKASYIPKETQWNKLKEILKNNENTEFGKKYNFSKINSVEDYQKAIPILKHTDLKPYLDKMVEGQKNILTAEDPIYYCMTSGSTGTPKMTPITESYRREYQAVVQTFLYHVYKDHPKAFNGKVIYFNGSAEMGKTPTGIPYGTMSGFNFVNLPPIVKKFYALPYEVAIVPDLPSRYYLMVLLALQKNISMMIGITAAPIITFLKSARNNTNDLLKDLHDGTIKDSLILTKKERDFFQSLHKPNPTLAKEFEQIINKSNGIFKPHEIWKNIDLLISWKSSTAGSYLKELNSFFDNKVTSRDAIYSATEGWCNIPYTDKVDGGPFAICAHFYEFVEENDEDNKKAFTVEQLEVGKRYKIIYTTSAGMYRYDIGDILEVTEKYNNTPCAKFYSKTGRATNISGEKMTENHVTMAFKNTFEKEGLFVPFYAMYPDQETFPPTYTALLELPDDYPQEKLTHLAGEIDKALCVENWEYKSHRDGGDLNCVAIKKLSKGSMEKLRAFQVKSGGDEAQIKPLILGKDKDSFEMLDIDQ